MMDEYAKYLEEKKAKLKGLSTFKLKVIGDVLMFLSAASMTLVPRFLGAPSTDDMGVLTVVVLCEAISWVAIPIYAWLLYMGFDRTRSWFKYGMRLFILALVCEVPYDMVTFGPDHLFDFRSQNPVFGLVVALVVMVLLDAVEDLKTGVRVTLSVLLVIIGLLWDVLLRVGQSQAILNIGSLTLGFCVIYLLLPAPAREHDDAHRRDTGRRLGHRPRLRRRVPALPQWRARLPPLLDAMGVLRGLPSHPPRLRMHGALIPTIQRN